MFRLAAVLALASALFGQQPRTLVVISIDGLDARFLTDPSLHVKAPNIRKLMRTGAFATVIGVAPSETWPSHASLVTGVSPWQHGITANELPGKPGERFFSSSLIHVPTLWDVAMKAGMKTATVYWPSTLGANVTYDLPEFWEARQGNAVPLESIAQKSTPPNAIPEIEKMFPRFDKALWDDSSSAEAATWLLSAEKPSLLLVHLAELDAEQHDTGALSIYSREILENDDELIGQLLAKLPEGAVVALVSDHGFENSNYTVRPKAMLRQAGIKGSAEVEDGLIGTRDSAAAEFLRKQVGLGRKSGIAREVPMAEVKSRAPALGRWVAAFDTLPNFIASDEERGAAVGPGRHLGVHGLWPSRPGYRAVLILAGADVKPRKLGDVDMLQVGPTFADVLGVRLPAAKSTSLWTSVTR